MLHIFVISGNIAFTSATLCSSSLRQQYGFTIMQLSTWADNLTAIRVCTEPIFFLFYAYHQIQSSQACEAHGRWKKPSLFFMLSRVSLFITLKYEQVFLWNFNAGSFAAQCLFSSAWLALQRWRCCFCGFLSVVRPKFRGTKLKPSKKKIKKRLLYCLDCEKTHIIQPSVATLHISSHSLENISSYEMQQWIASVFITKSQCKHPHDGYAYLNQLYRCIENMQMDFTTRFTHLNSAVMRLNPLYRWPSDDTFFR